MVLDVGSGMGFDALEFARAGSTVICCDIVESNLEVIRRMARLEQLPVQTRFLAQMSSIDALPEVDAIWCQGSMINAPFEVAAEESRRLLAKLRPGGRWIELGYPRERWVREGRMPGWLWGDRTDGGAPWMEWYDLPKLLRRLEPFPFDVVLAFNFHDDDFNWFDLRLRES